MSKAVGSGRARLWLLLSTLSFLGIGAPTPAEAAAGELPSVAPLAPERERALKPTDSFKECASCPEMVVVPAGSFAMDSPSGEEGRGEEEGPQHTVTFAQPFAVGRSAVTFAQWDACDADGGCNAYKGKFVRWGRGEMPAIFVSWDDAKAYVAWLSRKTGKPYRLLSEAEREYVTRAGTTSPYWWGSSISREQANYHSDTWDGDSVTRYPKEPMPVDSFAPNPWGLYQVHGNVYDWVEDCYHADYSGAPSDGSAWTAGECLRRVLRGGSWSSEPSYLRSAARYQIPFASEMHPDDAGIRVARTLAR
jgi:formylglycine-generating enzyme required for sulfatase activity